MRSAIVLFARSPEREAIAKRMPAAAPLFRAVIAAWLDAAERHGAVPLIACAAEDRDSFSNLNVIEQRGGSFGERVTGAAREALTRFDAVIIAAIDAPPPHDLDRAFGALKQGVAVVGPARDGGVNFIGITSLDEILLGRLTLRRCRERCPNLLVLHAVTDIDSQSSIAAARNEKAWRCIFESRAIYAIQRSHPRIGVMPALPPRAPPP